MAQTFVNFATFCSPSSTEQNSQKTAKVAKAGGELKRVTSDGLGCGWRQGGQCHLAFENWKFLGVWNLGFGISGGSAAGAGRASVQVVDFDGAEAGGAVFAGGGNRMGTLARTIFVRRSVLHAGE